MSTLHLNLGCGLNPIQGAINYDRVAPADVVHDLEKTPWSASEKLGWPTAPWDGLVWMWPESSVDEVTLHYALEHMGSTPALFQAIIMELHRVCKPGAKIVVTSVAPCHDDFHADPTIIRPIVPAMWRKLAPGEPLAKQWGVGFIVKQVLQKLDDAWEQDDFDDDERTLYRNLVQAYEMTIEVVK